jgi:hypothetical protein
MGDQEVWIIGALQVDSLLHVYQIKDHMELQIRVVEKMDHISILPLIP